MRNRLFDNKDYKRIVEDIYGSGHAKPPYDVTVEFGSGDLSQEDVLAIRTHDKFGIVRLVANTSSASTEPILKWHSSFNHNMAHHIKGMFSTVGIHLSDRVINILETQQEYYGEKIDHVLRYRDVTNEGKFLKGFVTGVYLGLVIGAKAQRAKNNTLSMKLSTGSKSEQQNDKVRSKLIETQQKMLDIVFNPMYNNYGAVKRALAKEANKYFEFIKKHKVTYPDSSKDLSEL